MSTFITCRSAYIYRISRIRHARNADFEPACGRIDLKRSLDIAAIVLTSLSLLGFAVLSFRGLIDPQPASARFGAALALLAITAALLWRRARMARI